MSVLAQVMDDPVEAASQPAAPQPETLADISAALRKHLGEERYDFWFDRKTRLSIQDDRLIVEAANAFAADWIRGKFGGELRNAALEAAGRPLEIRVQVASSLAHQSAPSRPVPQHPPAKPSLAPTHTDNTPPLRHTLEDFVVGPSNQMAFHAAQRVAERPGEEFNPLFLHGHCGLGKTHLLQGICQRFAKLHPDKKWLYMTAEQFTNDFLEAIRLHKTDAFRRRIRGARLLAIDDVHFLANKRATQQEFLHTFNQIDAGGSQIILASDCGPRDIRNLSDSLMSRFASGMVLRIDPPDLPTRLEILRRRAQRNGWSVSETILMHIAQASVGSVRELEGLLLQAVAGMRLIDSGGADETAFLSNLRGRTALPRPASPQRILAATSEHFGLSSSVILGPGREKVVSAARAITMFLARRHCGMSFPEIGRAIGGKNHSTVIAACQKVEAMLSAGDWLAWQINGEPRHQSVSDILHDLQAAIRRAPRTDESKR